jgi:hypothetical protein
MTITYHSDDLPFIADLLPDVHKFERTAIKLPIFSVAKSVGPDFHSTKIGYRVNFKASGNQVPPQIRPGVCGGSHKTNRLLVAGQASYVVIEFQVFCKKRFECRGIAAIESMEEDTVHMGDRAIKAVIGPSSLCMELAAARSQDHREKKVKNWIIHNLYLLYNKDMVNSWYYATQST